MKKTRQTPSFTLKIVLITFNKEAICNFCINLSYDFSIRKNMLLSDETGVRIIDFIVDLKEKSSNNNFVV